MTSIILTGDIQPLALNASKAAFLGKAAIAQVLHQTRPERYRILSCLQDIQRDELRLRGKSQYLRYPQPPIFLAMWAVLVGRAHDEIGIV